MSTQAREADERVALGASDLPTPLSARRPPGRILELDALRGLAAVTVVVGHSLVIFPNFDSPTRGVRGLGLVNLVKYTPLAILQSGEAAVVLFFVLSAFVLALPYLGPRAPSYPAFLAKRVCRIYVPYLAIVAVAILLAALLGGERLPGLSGWVDARWQGEFGVGLLLGHATLLGSFDNVQFDPVLWSLVHEMRISLIFPLLVVAVVVLGPLRSLAGAVAVLVVGLALNKLAIRLGHPSDLFRTLYYVPCFVAGILLARHQHAIVARWRRLAATGRGLLVAGGVALYTYPSWMDPAWFGHAHRHNIDDILAVTAGGAVFMVWALGSEGVGGFLRGRVPQFLGRISYSLYLLHAVVLLALLHLLDGTVCTLAIVALMWIVALPLAAASQRWIEIPAIGLGKRLATRFDGRAPPSRAGAVPATLA